ncbi:MAG: DUF938 domain-containing protein [Alphaproteobacteria bacterium]|nr:DUF938 domain-containing protein [Alphaproteobacteria bacterium]
MTLQRTPAADRNKVPLLEVLRRVLPAEGLVLEVASGTGQHARYFADALPGLTWQPSDVNDLALDTIRAWSDGGPDNLLPPIRLDVREPAWGLERADVILSVNLIHIAPWSATEGLVQGAARLLPMGGLLVTYGPYKVGGQHTAPGNERFDRSLRARNPGWGVRDIEDIQRLAAAQGLALVRREPMPVNNFTLVFRRLEM